MSGAYPALALVTAALAGLAFLADGFTLFQLSMALAYAVAILGLVVLTGWSGQVSLGQGALFGVGAYAAAILAVRFGLPFPVAVPLAGAVAMATGTVVGLAGLRLSGAHFGLATFAFAVSLPAIAKLPGIAVLTGAELGLRLPPSVLAAPAALGVDRWLYLLSVAVWAALSLAALNLACSRTGVSLAAIRENPVVAAASGLPVARLRLLAFALSSLCAGLGGALAAGIAGYVAPDSYTFVLSIGLVIGLVVGGVRSVAAALPGGLFLVFVPYAAEGFPQGMAGTVQGAVVAAVVLAAPGGLAGLAAWLARRRGG